MKTTQNVWALAFFLFALSMPLVSADLFNPLMSWSLDDGWEDNTGTADLVPQNTASISSVNPKLGNGTGFFDATTNSGAINESVIIPKNRAFSVWMNTTGVANGITQPIFSLSSDSTDQNWYVFLTNANNTLRMLNGNASAQNQIWEAELNFTIQNNTWYYIVGQQTNNNTPEFYVNGVKYPTQFVGGGTTNLDPTGATATTRLAQVGTTLTFNGSLDEGTFYNETLNETEIITQYNGGVGFSYADFENVSLIVSAQDIITGQFITGLCVNITNTTFSENQCTNTSTKIIFDENNVSFGNYTVQVYSLGFGNGINQTHTEVTQTLNFSSSTILVVQTSPTLSGNFSIRDEITEAFVNETTTVEVINNLNAQNYSVTSGFLFINNLVPGENIIRYRSTNYQEREYYVNGTTTNFENITLYSITINESSQLVVSVEDTGGDALDNAIVKLLRYYVSCNCYNIVQMAKTNSEGDALFWVQQVEGHYKWAIEFENATVFLSTDPEVIISTTRTFTVNLGEDFYESFDALDKISRTLSFNQTTGIMVFTWNDPIGIVTRGCVDAENLSGLNYVSIGEVCATGTAGSVIINLSNANETRYKYRAYIQTSTTYSDHTLFAGWNDPVGLFNFGNMGKYVAAIALMGLSGMFSFSAIAVLLINLVGMIAVTFLGIMTFGTASLATFAAVIIGLALYAMRR